MSSVVQIRDMKLGEGLPKICIPLTDPDCTGLKKSVAALSAVPCDFVEWRADHYKNPDDRGALLEALGLLRNELGSIPVLFTIRTREEGGEADMDTDTYTGLLLSVIESGLADMVDAELSKGPEAMKAIIAAAHAAGVKVVASCHDFSSTPDKAAIVDCLCRMQRLGADIAKFAAMPRCARDVLTLLDATLTMKEEHPLTPVITMSMGQYGAVSRICGELSGSCVTFGTAGKASAPGQLPADLLAVFLKSLTIK